MGLRIGWGSRRRSALRILAVAAVVVAADRAPAADPAPLVPADLVARIGRAAQDLARRGRRAECEELIDVASELRAAAADLAVVRDAAGKLLAKQKPVPLPIADAAKSIAKLAADVGATLATLDGDAKLAVARQTLRLDGSSRAAHEALGHVERGAAWIPAAVVPALERRGEIQAAFQDARKIEVPLEVEEGWMPILETLHGKKGIAVRSGDLSIHSASHSEQQLTRQFRQALRAAALANWLVNGELAVPPSSLRSVLVFVSTDDVYKRAVDEAAKAGEISADDAARNRKLSGFYTSRYELYHATGETDIGADVFFDVVHAIVCDGKSMRGTQPALLAGLMNWIYTNFLGHPMVAVAWTEKPEDRRGATSDTPQAAAERKEMMRLAGAGLAGSRLWMKWLVRRHEDPAWSKAMLDELGKVTGDPLLKATLVADYLFETARFGALLRDTWREPPGPETFEKALGTPLPAFEDEWRAWLLAGEPWIGLAQTLGAPPVEPHTAAEKAVLTYLDKVRRQALGRDAAAVGIDRELSDGCQAHAQYLNKHPKQLAAWPDAHEEFPGEEGFSPAGCRAGLSSVIAPGVDGPVAAIDGWMGTFYHRLPLLAPGLVRIGWGIDRGVAVLDSGSLVAPPDDPWTVRWPPVDAKDVPRRFNAELPNPVPGADQSPWGYPVTLQFFSIGADPDVQMRLYVGAKRGGAEIACHYSTPQKPTNAELAPDGSFCLIPKTPLAANTVYTVAVDGWPERAKTGDWQFTTGSQ